MQNSPLVSVLMTSYNRNQFIAEAIESVLASTYQNFELLIVDDCSKDNTASIAKDYASKDNRIKVFINENNLGDYPNRNRAASLAKGKYLKYLDSDDCILPEGLSTMINAMENVGSAGLGISITLDNDKVEYPKKLDAEQAYCYHYFKKPIFFASPGEVIFTRDAFNAVGGFSEKRMTSDFDMCHKISLQFPVVLLPGELLNIRNHPGREMKDQQKFAVDYERVKLFYLNNEDCPLSVNQVKIIKKNRRNTVFKIFIKKLFTLKFRQALPRFKVFCFYLVN